MKYPEHILAVPANAFEFIEGGAFRVRTNLKEMINAYDMQNNLVIEQRQRLDIGASGEGDTSRLQLLPYVVIRRWKENECFVLPYLRGKGTGETRLHGNGSIGFGGHVELFDVVHENGAIDLYRTLRNNIARELIEELNFSEIRQDDSERAYDSSRLDLDAWGVLNFAGYLLDNSNSVGKVHLGLVFTYDIPDDVSVSRNEEACDLLPWVKATEIEETYPNVVFENWSKFIMPHVGV